MSFNADPVLETLLLPFQRGLLQWPDDGALFLRARAGAPLQPESFPGLVCEQTFKPDADALAAAGFPLSDDERKIFPLVLILPPRQREEARALLARAVAMTAPGGRVLACQSNSEGARSMQSDLEQVAGPLTTLTKNHCRAVWSAPLDEPAELAQAWRTLDAPRPIADGRFVSRPGIFAWDRIDVASDLLASHLPANLAGDAADLGAGFGYLAVELLQRCPRLRSLDLYEAESRALDLARENVSRLEPAIPVDYHWHDVTMGLPRKYDAIVTNPPFHTSTQGDRPDIGRRFIAVAAEALKPGGRLWLVANRHLPYETVLNASFGAVRIVTQSGGFKIIEAIRKGGPR